MRTSSCRRATPLWLIFIGLMSIRCAAASGENLTVTSPAFGSGGEIPAKFTCKGAGENPPLQMQGVPRAAKSLVLTVEDPDAPGGLFSHWLVWNISPSLTKIAENSLPAAAVQGRNDFGKSGYGAPCPPSGTHRYFFRILALDRKLTLEAGAKRAALDQALRGHILARGEIMGRVSH
ncbi:MAG TPA: YbhB/YbcL family Raf kinase inhibitor-like protein [Chthoniobacterales bacterium]|jgi:hypothetical protein